METGRSAQAVAWYQRLSFRLALLLALTLVAFEYLCAPIYDATFRALGFPTEDVFVLPPELVEHTEDLARLLWKETDGSQEPLSEESSHVVSSVLEAQGEAFVLVDAERRVLAASDSLPWTRGDAWPHPDENFAAISLQEGPAPAARIISVPAGAEEQWRFVLLILHPEALLGADGSGAIVQSEEEFFAQAEREARVADVLSTIITVGVALLIGFAVSRLVTRRLRRLSSAAASPVVIGRDLPGPFDATGRDEISVLAATMNGMRDRAAGLIEGLARQDEKRREWVAQVSHDLRTPLTALMTCLDRAQLSEARDSPEKLRELISVARLDADRVHAIADDLLEISRLDLKDALQCEPVPPGELVRQAVQGFGPMAEGEGIELTADVGGNLPILEADGRRLMRALENLLRNALQHATARVQVRAAVAEEGLRFEVRDDGEGLPEQDGRVDVASLRTRRSRADSAGLGLTVTRKVAEAHGGTLGAYNLPAGGSAVFFDIPLPAVSG